MAAPWEKYQQQAAPSPFGQPIPLPRSPSQQADDARKASADARAARAEARAQAEFDMKYGTVPTPGDVTKTGDEYLATVDRSTAARAKALIEGRAPYPTGAALRSPQMQEIIAVATQADPTFDAANSVTRVATRKSFTSGPDATNMTALKTALDHIGGLYGDSQMLDNSSFTPWNAIANSAASTFGDPRKSNFETQRDAVATEVSRALQGGAPHQTEIEAWKNNLSSSASPDQQREAIQHVIGILGSRLDELQGKYQQGLGQTADVMQFLSPHSRDVYQHLGTGGDMQLPSVSPGAGAGAHAAMLANPTQPPPRHPATPWYGSGAPASAPRRSSHPSDIEDIMRRYGGR